MLYDIVVEFLGACPQGYEFIYMIFAFVLLLVGLAFVFVILNSFFRLFKWK